MLLGPVLLSHPLRVAFLAVPTDPHNVTVYAEGEAAQQLQLWTVAALCR